jgi:predicted aminopeptidase
MQYPRILLLLTATLFAAGCANLGYYSQAVTGQLDILAHTRAISELLDESPVTGSEPNAAMRPLAPAIKTRLTTVLRVRDFATQVLALPDNGSYRVYADIDRAQVAWNIVATPEFSLTPKEWCFPVAGCVPYRGYFSQKRAQRFADTLRADGQDVRVAGVAAYSTLGWFRDPVFSTQLRRSDADIAALIFHELAHQKLYVGGDATFNESFATAVETEGMRRWLVQGNDKTALDNYLLERSRQTAFVDLLTKYRTHLAALFATPLPEEKMRAEKARYYDMLRAEYVELRKLWGGYGGYDTWFTQDLNNAHLASVGLYHQYVPAFQALLASVHGDLPAFYRLARMLSYLSAAERAARLTGLNGAPTALITIK